MKKHTALPKVEKGVPIPHVKLKDGRNKAVSQSKWRGFLLGLHINDSFVVEWPECSSVRSMAKSLNVELVWVQLPEKGPNNRPQERYWCMGKGGGKSGAHVQYCGHDGWFIADIYAIGNVYVVRANGKVTADNLTRPATGATHHLVDFPEAGFWRPDIGVFVVPRKQVIDLSKT